MTDSDPIMATPNGKRRKLNNGQGVGKSYDSEDDSGDDYFDDEEVQDTVATLPVTASQRPQQRLTYTNKQLHKDLASMGGAGGATLSSQTLPNTLQPTQGLGSYITQPTQPLPKASSPSSQVQVARSSPPAAGDEAGLKPSPLGRVPFAKPRSSLIGSYMGPAGTTLKRPVGAAQPKQVITPSSDSEEDAPIDYTSDDEGPHGRRSDIKPTNFTRNGRPLQSSPERVVQESPRPAAPAPSGGSSGFSFSNFVSEYRHAQSPQRSRPTTDDMASAYGSSTRAPRPQPPTSRQEAPSHAQPVAAAHYRTLDDIPDYHARNKAERIKKVLPSETIQRIVDALKRKHYNEQDAMAFLVETSTEGDIDELAPSPMKPAAVRGVARPAGPPTSSSSSQPVRPPVKASTRQDVKAPTLTIAEKYNATQAARKSSQVETRPVTQDDEEDGDVRPRKGRILQRARPVRSPSPVASPQIVKPAQRPQKPVITIDSDSESGVMTEDEEEDVVEVSSRDGRLLTFFNESTVQDIVDLSAQPEADVKFVLSKRPFSSLEEIRELQNAPETTKSGKKSRARATGEKMVELCSDMLRGYDAVDDLVKECENLSKPIQEALKSWGFGENSGELQLMNLEEAHDSGIGTPSSSCAPDDTPNAVSKALKVKRKGRFLGQPENMSPDITLKDYQLVGLNWLNLLWSKQLSCILADDMGLGKTCQVISFLSYLQTQKVDGVHLVIVPGSTLENWLREFQHFSPDLKVVPYYGSQAERPELQVQIESDFDTIDVIVTTYDMTIKPDDNKFLRNLGPSVCVYDEAHALRNPKSDRYRQLMRIPADFKILLTGTPLQNNLRELIAILAFIMPELFSEKREELEYIFQHKATTKDADHAALLSAERIRRARSMMTPFILRRKKAQVLWLPAKHSRVEHCSMTSSQEELYNEVFAEAQDLFAQKADGKKTNAKASSNVLMSLRKAAIHPLLSRHLYTDAKLRKIQTALLKHDEFSSNPPDKVWDYLTGSGKGPYSIKGGDFGLHQFCAERDYLHKYALKHEEWMDCGKVRKFKQLVQEYAANGDRALVFSQFTTLMDILEAVLSTLGIRYMRLDGQTRMDTRQDMIDEFYQDEDIRVFMLSTKAGGAGINLACANKVIIFDSGFNPQDDIQAENRAHRVGQTREVEVIRLVTSGTIEEQIHALGESKLALDERVAGEGASAADEKQAEKMGEKAVEEMLMLKMKDPKDMKDEAKEVDLKDEFKKGLEGAGLAVE